MYSCTFQYPDHLLCSNPVKMCCILWSKYFKIIPLSCSKIYFKMWFPFIECQREKEKKSLHQQILKDDLTLNGLELYCCMSRDISFDNFYNLQCVP